MLIIIKVVAFRIDMDEDPEVGLNYNVLEHPPSGCKG